MMLGKNRTQAEQARINAIHERGCVPCWLEAKLQGRQWSPEPCDIHHVDQSDWSKTYGNCPWHHRGVRKVGIAQIVMRVNFGPSMAKEPMRYHERYGTEYQLLAFQGTLLLKSPRQYIREI